MGRGFKVNSQSERSDLSSLYRFDKATDYMRTTVSIAVVLGRLAAIMSLIQSARMNGHDPYAYLKDVLTRLPTQRASEITDLLPHKWVNSLG